MNHIRLMKTGDARRVAELHMMAITEGFLNRLGQRFLTQLYTGISKDPESMVWVSETDGEVDGFCAYSKSVAGLYKRILRRRFLQLGLAAMPHAFRPSTIKECVDTLRYPKKQIQAALPPAEILSIAVSASTRGTGIGKRLLEEALKQARLDDQPEIKVLAGAKLDGANRFYLSCGFNKRTEIVQHGETLNVYVAALTETCAD